MTDYSTPRGYDGGQSINANRYAPDECASILDGIPTDRPLTDRQRGQLQVVIGFGTAEQREQARARLTAAEQQNGPTRPAGLAKMGAPTWPNP